MKRLSNYSLKTLPVIAGLFFVLVFCLAACTPAQTQATDMPMDQENSNMDAAMDNGNGQDMEHDHSDGNDARVPNNGAVIKIVSPANNATFNKDEDVLIEIETENFDLSADGNHWHLYVDGTVWTMVSEGSTKSVLHGLEPGSHDIDVYLGLPTPED